MGALDEEPPSGVGLRLKRRAAWAHDKVAVELHDAGLLLGRLLGARKSDEENGFVR